MASEQVHCRTTPIKTGWEVARHRGPAHATIARNPHTAGTAVGGGRQSQAIVAHPDRSPVARQAGFTPFPVGLTGVGQVNLAPSSCCHQQSARGIHVHGQPIAIADTRRGDVLPVRPSEDTVGARFAQIQSPICAFVRRSSTGRQQARAIGIAGHGRPVRIGRAVQGAPSGAVSIKHTHQARRVVGLPAPVEDVLEEEIPVAVGLVQRHHARVVLHQNFGVVVCWCLALNPADATIPGQHVLARHGEGSNGLAIGGNRHSLVIHAAWHVHGHPTEALVTRDVNAQLCVRSLRDRHQDVLANGHFTPILRDRRCDSRLQLGRGFAAQAVLIDHHIQGLAGVTTAVDHLDAIGHCEIGVELVQRTGEGDLGRVGTRDRHAIGAHRLNGPGGQRQRDRRLTGQVATKRLAVEIQRRGLPHHHGVGCRHRHGRSIWQGSNNAQQLGRQTAREVNVADVLTVFGQGIDAQGPAKDISVNALAAQQLVDALKGIQGVVATTAVHLVRSGTTVQHVVAQTAIQFVTTPTPDQQNRCRTAGQSPQHVVTFQVDRFAATGAQQQVVVASTTGDFQGHAALEAAGIERVVALAHVHQHMTDATELLIETLEFHTHNVAAFKAAEDESL